MIEGRYWVSVVATGPCPDCDLDASTESRAALGAGATDFATVLAAVGDGAWDRSGLGGDGNRFTIDGLARFTLHEAHHHLRDAKRSLDPT